MLPVSDRFEPAITGPSTSFLNASSSAAHACGYLEHPASTRSWCQRFIRENYPSTPVFGHGEVNPGHKEADEGMAIVNAIRQERSNQTANKQ
jgi:hypothetical protein